MDDAPAPSKPSTVLLDPETGEPYTARRNGRWGKVDLVDGDLRAHIQAAYASAGGVEYLRALAVSNTPSDRTAFMSLLGRLVPTEIKGSMSGNITLELVNYAQPIAPAPLTIDMPVQSPLLE